MTFEVPAHTQPGTILMPDGKILWRDHEWHAFGNFTVSYEQAQFARAHGWGYRTGMFLEAEHADETSMA